MSRSSQIINAGNLAALGDCLNCQVWQHDPAATGSSNSKELWLRQVLTEFGPPGVLAFQDHQCVGHLLAVPASYLPGANRFQLEISADALLVAGWFVAADQQWARKVLLQNMLALLHHSNYLALEVIANPFRMFCTVPPKSLERLGFELVASSETFAKYRLNIASIASWRTEISSVLEQIKKLSAPPRRLIPEAGANRHTEFEEQS